MATACAWYVGLLRFWMGVWGLPVQSVAGGPSDGPILVHLSSATHEGLVEASSI
ncbi:MAG: hypothetical protein ACK5KM_06345 [Hyphomicrobiaceae bacterium]